MELVSALIASDESLPANIRTLAEDKPADACWLIADMEHLGKAFFGGENRCNAVHDLGKNKGHFVSVSSDFIDESMAMLSAKFPNAEMRLFNTHLSQLIYRSEDAGGGGAIVDFILDQFQGFRIALIPMYVPLTNGNEMEHWVLVSVDLVRSELKIYDSCEEETDRYAEAAAMHVAMRGMVTVLATALEIVTGAIFAVSNVSVPQQLNKADCGVCCVEFARRLVIGEPIDRKTLWPQVRRDMTVELVAWWRDMSN